MVINWLLSFYNINSIYIYFKINKILKKLKMLKSPSACHLSFL